MTSHEEADVIAALLAKAASCQELRIGIAPQGLLGQLPAPMQEVGGSTFHTDLWEDGAVAASWLAPPGCWVGF